MGSGKIKSSLLALTFAAVAVVLTFLFNELVPQPYMDEVFHVPQAKRYCNGDTTWDSKITTLPGTYVLSVFLLRLPIVSSVLGSNICSLMQLRSVNLLLGLGCTWTICKILLILWKRDGQQRVSQAVTTAVVISLFPVHFFFFFLYYTDVGSTFFVLLMYLLVLEGKHGRSALAGVVAVCFRQTNIVWMALTAGTAVLQLLHNEIYQNTEIVSTTTKSGLKASKPEQQANHTYPSLITLVGQLLWCSVAQSRMLLQTLWPFAASFLAFGIFVMVNNGIVVGDRSNHQAVLHWPQLGYFIVFACGMLCPVLISWLRVENRVRKGRATLAWITSFVLLSAAYGVMVWRATLVHEFVLADNRHYTFYLWRRTIGSHWAVKYAAVPVYSLGSLVLNRMLCTCQEPLWVLGYWTAVGLVLVPQRLIEPRYFILPYLFLRLHIPRQNTKVLAAEALFYIAINVMTIEKFLYRPFFYSDWGPEPQRFLW